MSGVSPMSLPDRPGGQGSKPRRDTDEGRERLTPAEHRLGERLEAWARQSPHRGNAFAITATAFLMVWLLAGSRDLPERDSMRLGIGLTLAMGHGCAHGVILWGLKRWKARGLAAAETALRSYLARVTQRDLALAWGLFALFAWLS